jgi:multiple sugar transport system permease protein
VRKPFATIMIYGLALAGAVFSLVPLLWMASASVMPAGEASSFPPPLFPSEITWQHYIDLFGHLNIGRYFFNSLLIASLVTVISVTSNSMAGYAFAKFHFPGRDGLFRFLIGGLVIPVQVAMLPLFLLLKEFGLINTYWGVVFPSMATIFGIFLVRQYALSIPNELLDAARIDGAGEFRIYWTIIVPLCKPILVTLAIFTFMASWNDFMWPLIILSDDAMYTLPVALANMLGEHVQDVELMMAGSVLTVLPVLVIFMALQKSYIDGIMLGSVKG